MNIFKNSEKNRKVLRENMNNCLNRCKVIYNFIFLKLLVKFVVYISLVLYKKGIFLYGNKIYIYESNVN